MASAGRDKKVVVWDMMTKKPLAEHSGAEPMTALAWQPDGNCLASFSEAGEASCWQGAVPDDKPSPSAALGTLDLAAPIQGTIAGILTPDLHVQICAEGSACPQASLLKFLHQCILPSDLITLDTVARYHSQKRSCMLNWRQPQDLVLMWQTSLMRGVLSPHVPGVGGEGGWGSPNTAGPRIFAQRLTMEDSQESSLFVVSCSDAC